MTKQECAIVMAYTGVCMLEGDDFDIFHEYVEKLMGRPLQTYEIVKRIDEIKKKAKPNFIALCESVRENSDE